jgi:DNA-binding response OmpR family regulator
LVPSEGKAVKMLHPAILIVDDDRGICALIAERLSEDGYVCDTAPSAEEALIKIQNHYFDLAILDIKLPGKSGIELLGTFQSLCQNTEIVMMTAVRDLDTVIEAMKLGASDYVLKPFTFEKLSTSINSILRNHREASPTTRQLRIPEKLENDNRPKDIIDAIAWGVDAQVDYYDFHSKMVKEQTIELAKGLCIPAKDIDKWVSERNRCQLRRNRYIESALNNLQQNPLAQVIFGLTRSINGIPDSDEKQN